LQACLNLLLSCHAECRHLFSVMLTIIMVNLILLNVNMLSAIVLSVYMLSAIVLSVTIQVLHFMVGFWPYP